MHRFYHTTVLKIKSGPAVGTAGGEMKLSSADNPELLKVVSFTPGVGYHGITGFAYYREFNLLSACAAHVTSFVPQAF